jgi:crossover junction endodeoxyribonuclease RusA
VAGTDAVVIRLTLPLPPSINSYHRSVVLRGGVGKVLISATGRRWRKQAMTIAQMQAGATRPIDGDVRVRVRVYFQDRRRDLGNVEKPLSDLLEGIAYANDRQISDMHYTRHIDRGNPRVEVEVQPCEGDK